MREISYGIDTIVEDEPMKDIINSLREEFNEFTDVSEALGLIGIVKEGEILDETDYVHDLSSLELIDIDNARSKNL